MLSTMLASGPVSVSTTKLNRAHIQPNTHPPTRTQHTHFRYTTNCGGGGAGAKAHTSESSIYTYIYIWFKCSRGKDYLRPNFDTIRSRLLNVLIMFKCIAFIPRPNKW